MKIHRKIMIVVGAAMLLILTITTLSLHYLNASFSTTAEEMKECGKDSRRIWIIERNTDQIFRAIQNFLITGDHADFDEYGKTLAELHEELRSALPGRPGQQMELLRVLIADLDRMERKADGIFSFAGPATGRNLDLLHELRILHGRMEQDVSNYQEWHEAHTAMINADLGKNTIRINYVFQLVLLTSLGAILVFVIYIHRKVSVPLQELWEGAEEISRGNLDYQMKVRGGDDIARLSRRFNEMAIRLKTSYADLEQKLYERTRELASLDAVALTLSHAGSLRDVLDKSLLRILDSLGKIEPRGGVFLCEPGGETLRLVAHHGLTPEFVKRESIIRTGECLCGLVAGNGELLFRNESHDGLVTRRSCEDCSACIVIPIKSRGIVLGVIFLYPEKDFKLKSTDIQMLEAIGAQLGMAVENFRFYAEVKESSEKYWDLFENATEILFTIDASGKMTAVNKAAERFTGYSKIELFGKSVFDFLTPQGIESARKMLEGGDLVTWTEFEVVKRDGGRAFVEVSGRRLFMNRKPSGFQVSARDVTEQRRLREMLLHAERLGAIGQVVVTVRHEINNPLTTVIGNTELLMERYDGKDRELMGRLETILNNALRIAEIVKKLQAIKKDKVVEYREGVKMTDLTQGEERGV